MYKTYYNDKTIQSILYADEVKISCKKIFVLMHRSVCV